MKVLVTGATGFVGKHLVPLLLRENLEVSVLVRNRDSLEDFDWSKSTVVFQGDITRPESLQESCRSQDLIIHCAGHAHSTDTDEELHSQTNYEGTRNLLEAALKAGVGKFIFLSSNKVISACSTPYARSKQQAEELLMKAHAAGGIRVCCLRSAAVYGIGMKGNLHAWIRRIQRGRAPSLPPVQNRIAMVGVRDLCAAILSVAASDETWGKCYFVSDGFPYGIKDIEDRLRQGLNLKPNRFYFPRSLFLGAACLGDFLERSLGIKTGFGISGYNTLFCDEFTGSEILIKETDFLPEQNFFSELADILKEYQKQP